MKTTKSFRIYESPVIPLLRVMLLMLLSDLLFAILLLLFDFAQETNRVELLFTIKEKFFLFVLFVQFIFMAFIFLQWIFNYYWFEDGILHHKKGLIWVNKREFILNELEVSSFSKSLFGRLFDYGTVSIVFANQKFLLRRIPSPEVFVYMIKEEKRKSEN